MAAFAHMTVFFLVSSTLEHTVFSGMFKPHNLSKWPTPPCELYHPTDVLYDSVCPDVTAHVCATNGHTYQNECFFCLDQWEFGPHIQFNRYGRCE
ncbi:serine protease inhibitor Kazal-type 13 [Equus przewalskii]|uniref:Kazal-like domain-containing protein n=2 Tax=Equus TaxID=9789 RepID=A0A5F5PS55_HORSE|nr:serine protease inhibitor Kazal-type 13 [Equus caballus]XP_008521552.1 PREDICTED: serine protease inhibitor Kazal-type 13 [Equus przewalskii]